MAKTRARARQHARARTASRAPRSRGGYSPRLAIAPLNQDKIRMVNAARDMPGNGNQTVFRVEDF
jgi:hypothetical protein